MTRKTVPPHRLLSRRSGGVFLLAAATLTSFTGCSVAPPSPLLTVQKPNAAASKRAKESDKYNSINKALGQLDAKTVQTWINRWTSPNGAIKNGAAKGVRIDAEVLARRHPAWHLAAALEAGAIAPDSPQISRVLAIPDAGFNPSKLPGELSLVRTLPAKTVSDGFDEVAARRRQSAALERFFASAAARDSLHGRDDAYLARRDLEDAIVAAQRGAVADLDLYLVPADVALQLTNLRLQLLRSLSRTSAQRADSRAQIQAIQAKFAQIWSQQTNLQEARMREATIGLPARLRKEGLTRIEGDIAKEERKRLDARSEVQTQTAVGLDADFEKDVRDLHLVLPATRKVESLEVENKNSHSQFFETSGRSSPSATKRNLAALAARRRVDSQIIVALRSKARREARRWASLVAAQLGSRWDNNPANLDRTAAALAVLFPKAPLKSRVSEETHY